MIKNKKNEPLNLHKIKATDTEINKIINNLDFFSRICIGQYNEISFILRWYMSYKIIDRNELEIEKIMLDIRNILLPNFECKYSLNASYGIFSPEIDYRAAVAYNMQQEFRYKLAWCKEPKGGWTVDFGKPLPNERDKNPWPTAICTKLNDGTIVFEASVTDEQYKIIKTAASVYECLMDCEIKKLFEYYTDNKEALKLAQKLTDIFTLCKKEEDE